MNNKLAKRSLIFTIVWAAPIILCKVVFGEIYTGNWIVAVGYAVVVALSF